MDDPLHRQVGECGDDERDVIERPEIDQGEADDRRARQAGISVASARHAHPLHPNPIKELTERERHHEEIDFLPPDGDEAEQRGEDHGGDHRKRRDDAMRQAELHCTDGDHVPGDCGERHLHERDHVAKSREQDERHRNAAEIEASDDELKHKGRGKSAGSAMASSAASPGTSKPSARLIVIRPFRGGLAAGTPAPG